MMNEYQIRDEAGVEIKLHGNFVVSGLIPV